MGRSRNVSWLTDTRGNNKKLGYLVGFLPFHRVTRQAHATQNFFRPPQGWGYHLMHPYDRRRNGKVADFQSDE